MRVSIELVLLVGALAGGGLAVPQIVVAQTPAVVECAASREADPFLADVARARDIADPEAAKTALAALDPEARRRAAESPDDPAAQYDLAAVMGARLELEHGTDKMEGAEVLSDQATRVLELDPVHPGASYMLGKIHSSILRMSGVKRFLAGRLFGSGRLKGASWDRAQALLETATHGEPCVPENHFELARVYAHRGEVEAARREIGYVRQLTQGQEGRAARVRQKAEDLARELSDRT